MDETLQSKGTGRQNICENITHLYVVYEKHALNSKEWKTIYKAENIQKRAELAKEI